MTMPTLSSERSRLIARAHRMRSAVTVEVMRKLFRWATVASR